MKLPKVQSLPLQTAIVLEQRIRNGTYLHTLPGEPTLTKDLQVSRGTLRKALTKLTADGVLLPPKAGQRRQITTTFISNNKPARTKNVAVLLSVPQDDLHASSQDLLRALRKKLEGSGIQSSFYNIPFQSMKRPHRRLNELLETHSADAWIILEASYVTAQWFCNHNIPHILCGGRGPEESPQVAYDGTATTHHAIQSLLRKGHQRIVNLVNHETAGLSKVAEAIYAEKNISFDPNFHICSCGSTPDETVRNLHRLFKHKEPPTVLFTWNPHKLITLVTWLGNQGYRVPHDVSVINIGTDPIFKSVIPNISYYSTDYPRLVTALHGETIKLLEIGKAESKHLIMDYIPGKSVRSIRS